VEPPTQGLLNLKQVAARLGVHYMTAYRYVRTGRLPARRVGTGWVVEVADVTAFSADAAAARAGSARPAESGSAAEGGRSGSSGRSRSGAAGGDRPHGADRLADWRGRLRATLAAGDETAAWRVIEQALAAGHSPASCYLDLLVGAINDISGRSVRPEYPVAQEYLAVATAGRLVARLGARFRRPGRSRGTVVFGAPLGEHHTLAIAVVADLVRLEGFNCLELGANVPPEAFAGAAADAYRLIAVGIGVTTPNDLDAVRQTVQAVRGVRDNIPIVLGGQAADPATGSWVGADAWATDGRQAVEIISELAHQRRRLSMVESGDEADGLAGGSSMGA
jgi:excisionase family DNA binding protein